MEKNKKLFEPIRRGAPSLPFDFTEELKEMEIVFPYPKKIGENKYKIIDNKKIKGNYNDKGQNSIFCRRRFCN